MVLGGLVGLVDSDYQGPLMVSCWSRGSAAVPPPVAGCARRNAPRALRARARRPTVFR